MTDETAAGPRRDGTGLGTFVPMGLVVGGGVGMRIGGVGTPIGGVSMRIGAGMGTGTPRKSFERC